MMLHDFVAVAFSNPIRYIVRSRDDEEIDDFVVDWDAKKHNFDKLHSYSELGAEVSYFTVGADRPRLNVFVTI